MNNNLKRFTFWHGLLLAEVSAILIGLAMTIVPGKTGSKYGLAGHFFQEPTFMQEFLFNFVIINVLLVILALVIFFMLRRNNSGKP